ncbi:unnamed protein product, partial [marine sediment metagenome]
TNYQKFTSECMYSGNLDKARAEGNPWLPALEEVVNRLSISTLERIMEGTMVWILDGIPTTLGGPACYVILLPEGDWSFEARVGIIAHEFAHTMDGLETCIYESDADDLATHWGFGKEVEVAYEKRG